MKANPLGVPEAVRAIWEEEDKEEEDGEEEEGIGKRG